MLAIMPSVAPQQTAISRSGSNSIPYVCRYLLAMASRNGLAPQVIAYWLISASMASAAARLSASGAGKSGSLGQVDGVMAQRQAGHFANHRFRELHDAPAAKPGANGSGGSRHLSRVRE